jgi:hypothetical protein
MAPSTPPRPKRVPKPSAKVIRNQETRAITEALDHDGRSSPSHGGDVGPSTHDGGATDLGTLIQLIADLKETIIRQSSIIENQNSGIEDVRAELGEIKAEQRTLKNQNLELQEEVRSLRTQLDSYSASLPSTRSWASVASAKDSNLGAAAVILGSNTDSDTWCPRSREPTGIKCSKNGERSGAQREKASICGKLTADCHPSELNDYMAHYLGVEHTYSHNFEPATPGWQHSESSIGSSRRTVVNVEQSRRWCMYW